MAKSKNHTNKNQNKKDHKNGIKKPKFRRHCPYNMLDPKFVREMRALKRNDPLDKASKSKASKLQAAYKK